jgi:hypothetical protein
VNEFGDLVNDVDRWFSRTARRSAEPVALYPSLLTAKVPAYLRYRLRYPLLIAAVRFAVHVAEFFILMSSLGGVAAFTVMVLRAGSLVVAGGWWGLLEVMRERLRGFAAAGNRDASGYEIGRWLVLAAALALTATVGGAVVLGVWNPTGADPLARLYAFLIVVEFAIDLPVRVLHSGVYATRRIYKPAWSMVVPILVQLVILGAGFYLYPGAAIVIAIVVSNALALWITVHFTLEVYRLMGLRPQFAGRRWWRELPSIPPRMAVETTLSGLSLRLDAILVLALVGFYGTNTRTFDLTAGLTSWRNIDAFQFFYLILPLFRGTYESAGLFYFDLVRLRTAAALRPLQLRFFRDLVWVSPLIALFFWALAAGLGLVVLNDVPPSFLFALMPMFLLRSLIGVYQIRLFAEGRFGIHLATLALLAVMLWLVWLNPNPAGDLLQITAAMIIQLIVLINLQHFSDRRDPPLPTLLQRSEWIQARARESEPTTAGSVRIPGSITAKQKSAVIDLMSRTFDGTGHVTFGSPTSLLYYHRGPEATPAHLALTELTGGAVGRGAALPGPVAAGPCGDKDALTDEFRTLFDDGIVFDTETLSGAATMRTLDPAVLAATVPAALAALADGSDMVAVSDRWLTPEYRGGVLHRIHVLPGDPDPARLRQWREALRRHG